MPKAADAIAVKEFRQIFTWPFVMTDEMNAPEWFEACKNRLNGSAWKKTPPSDLMPDCKATGLYEEAVYFHDFIRRSLYMQRQDVCTYQRPSLRKLVFTLEGKTGHDRQDYPFAVSFNALHIYHSGAAILTLELVYKGTPLDLATVQTLIDRLRRAYPPFWGENGQPGLSPLRAKSIETTGADAANPVEKIHPLTRLKGRESAQKALLDNDFHEPLFSWWRHILAPLTVKGNADPDGDPTREGKPLLRQVLDERIPVMTTIALDPQVDGKNNPAAAVSAISDGDWFRIAGADAAGSDPYPYNPDFLDTQRAALFYDRFLPYKSGPDWSATRFAFAGYHFAAVGAGGFFDTHLTEHVRRHYRQMQHLCLLEFATLLSISQRLCTALDLRDGDGHRAFRQEILQTQSDFMDFTHRFHFTGVSNQLQARELFDRFRDSMELDARYAEIKAELDSASELARAEEQREETLAAQNLTEVATVAAVVGVAAALASMNLVLDEEQEVYGLLASVLPWLRDSCAGLAFDAALFGALLCLTTVGAGVMFAGKLQTVRTKLWALLGLGAVLMLGFGALAVIFPADCAPPPEVQVIQ